MALTGQALINAVAVRIGIASASDSPATEPSRAQILEVINTCARAVARASADTIPELWKTVTASSATNVLVPLALSVDGVPATYMSRSAYLSAVKAAKGTADAPIYTFAPQSTPDGGTVYLVSSPTGSAKVFDYVAMPADFTDAASRASGTIPERFDYDVIRLATYWLKIGDGQDYSAQIIAGAPAREM